MRYRSLACLAIFGFLSFVAQAQTRYRVVELGPIDPYEWTSAYSINYQGDVTGRFHIDLSSKAAVWTNGVGAVLEGPNQGWVEPTEINDSGVIAGYWTNSLGHESIAIWGPSGNTFLGAGKALDINGFGDVVGYSSEPGTSKAILIRNGNTTYLSPDESSKAYGISNAGYIVGETLDPARHQKTVAFRWRNGTLTELGRFFTNRGYQALKVNNLGWTIGLEKGGPADAPRPLLWRDTAPEVLPLLPGYEDWAWTSDINNRGEIVGGADHNVNWGQTIGWIWRNGQMLNLNSQLDTPGYIIRNAHGINDQGWIVGSAVAPSGGGRAVILIPTNSERGNGSRG